MIGLVLINNGLIGLSYLAGLQGGNPRVPTGNATTAPAVVTPAPALPGLSAFNILDVLQFGLLGLIFVCVVLKKFVVPEWVLHDTEQRLESAQEQLEALQKTFEDQMIPALTRATEVNARYTDELQRARYLGQQQGRAQERGPGAYGQ